MPALVRSDEAAAWCDYDFPPASNYAFLCILMNPPKRGKIEQINSAPANFDFDPDSCRIAYSSPVLYPTEIEWKGVKTFHSPK
jgi:hypothetical protein